MVQLLKAQLEAKDSQIAELQTALLEEQANNKQLLSQLSAAQALHAGTIQQQLLQEESGNIGIFARIRSLFGN